MPGRRRMLAASAAVAVLSVYPHGASAVADLDTGGFIQNGKTTYCQGVHVERGPLVFEELTTDSRGKCPINVQITVSSMSVKPQTPVLVTWSASVHNGALSSNLFPNTVDPTTKKPQDVVASLLRACEVGTNCAVPTGVVIPADVGGETAADAGAFDATGVKPLASHTLLLPKAGQEYLIVGKVVLPGDGPLNISATEFVAFQRVRVLAPGETASSPSSSTPVAATVRPADASPLSQPVPAPTQAPKAATPSPADSSVSSASGNSSGTSIEVIAVVVVLAVVFIAAVAAYIVIVRKEKRELNRRRPPPSPSDRRTIALPRREASNRYTQATTSKSAAKPLPYAAAAAAKRPSSPPRLSETELPPPQRRPPAHRPQQPSSSTYSRSYDDYNEQDSSNRNTIELSDPISPISDTSMLDSYESTDIYAADLLTTSTLAVLEDPTLSSDLSSFGDLHDSSVSIQPLPKSRRNTHAEPTHFERVSVRPRSTTAGNAGFYARDTSEYLTSFSERYSESFWSMRTTASQRAHL